MIRVYSVETGAAVLLHPIDAREQLALGIVTAEEAAPAGPVNALSSKAELVAKAVDLGVGPPSQLSRWGEARLLLAIAEKEG